MMTKIERMATAFIIVDAMLFAIRLLSGIADGATLLMLIVGIMSISALSLYSDNLKRDRRWRID